MEKKVKKVLTIMSFLEGREILLKNNSLFVNEYLQLKELYINTLNENEQINKAMNEFKLLKNKINNKSKEVCKEALSALGKKDDGISMELSEEESKKMRKIIDEKIEECKGGFIEEEDLIIEKIVQYFKDDNKGEELLDKILEDFKNIFTKSRIFVDEILKKIID